MRWEEFHYLSNMLLDFCIYLPLYTANAWCLIIYFQMEDQLADCREVFCYFDSKGDEKISVQQVRFKISIDHGIIMLLNIL